MRGIAEIKRLNKPGPNYRIQRDRLAQVVRHLLAGDPGAEADARKVLMEVYGGRAAGTEIRSPEAVGDADPLRVDNLA